ncbi:MAG: amidohydrolase, partial [Oxalobacteraceae bacterium]
MRDLSTLPNLNIALVQTTLVWHDASANHAHFEELLAQAKGADLVILPEMFTTGFT